MINTVYLAQRAVSHNGDYFFFKSVATSKRRDPPLPHGGWTLEGHSGGVWSEIVTTRPPNVGSDAPRSFDVRGPCGVCGLR